MAHGRPALLRLSPGPCPEAYSLLGGSIPGAAQECDGHFHCSCCGNGGKHPGSRPRDRATEQCYDRYNTGRIGKCV